MKKYEPTTGTEMKGFMASHCMKCKFCNPNAEGVRQCDTLYDALMFNSSHEKYPSEWTFTKKGEPTCTKRQGWNWEDGTPEEPTHNPNQVSMFQN